MECSSGLQRQRPTSALPWGQRWSRPGGLGAEAAADEGVDPEADRVLRAMSGYLGGLARFSIDAPGELVIEEGE